ncbi:hypothetical protein BZA77DRAFT_304087 [Pyronema omphalodes]|nr:hypothetical protein BZA77DRAFT_304087 [Pyronema omphalodes]
MFLFLFLFFVVHETGLWNLYRGTGASPASRTRTNCGAQHHNFAEFTRDDGMENLCFGFFRTVVQRGIHMLCVVQRGVRRGCALPEVSWIIWVSRSS